MDILLTRWVTDDKPITDENNQAALKNGRLRPTWYDYLLILSPTADGLPDPVRRIVLDGLINWWILEDY